MKKLVLSILVLCVFCGSAFAADDLNCSTPKNPFGGYENISVTPQDLYTATIQGAIHGGMAHYIQQIGPIPVKVSYQSGEIVFSNPEQGVELDVMTGSTGGELQASAQFKDGPGPAVSMSCQVPNL